MESTTLRPRATTNPDNDKRDLERLAMKHISKPAPPSGGTTERSYISLKDLEDLLSSLRIRRILGRYQVDGSFGNIEIIRNRFLRVFSLLVWCSAVHELRYFIENEVHDGVFPLNQRPQGFRSDPNLDKVFESIYEHQWLFFPLELGPDLLDGAVESPERILPIQHEELVSHKGEEASVYKTILDPEYTSKSVPRKTEGNVVVVRKVYIGSKHRSMFDRERSAYRALLSRKCDNIVRYYGSFTQKQADGEEVHSLLLEHVDGTTLEQFFESTPPPQNKLELVRFWRGFEGLFVALHHFYNQSTDSFQIVHQDLHPRNLMITGTHGLSQNLLLKVVDFGYSFTTSDRNTKFLDMIGGKVYGAPECSHHESYMNDGPNTINPSADVWSAGCVMSEAAVWAWSGPEGLQAYRDKRNEEACNRAFFSEAGLGPCFHNGVYRLRAVDSCHQEIISNIPDYHEDITKPIIELIQESMLPNDERMREQPRDLKSRLCKLLENAEPFDEKKFSSSWDSSNPSTPNQGYRELSIVAQLPASSGFAGGKPLSSPLSSPLSPRLRQSTASKPSSAVTSSSVPEGPRQKSSLHDHETEVDFGPASPRLHLSWAEAQVFMNNRKLGSTIEEEVESTVRALEANLRDRDHIFLVDTSASMIPYMQDIRNTLQVYTYITKNIDQDGIEVCFTCEGKLQTHKTSTSVLKAFDRQTWNGFGFEDKFGDFTGRIIDRLQRRNFLTRRVQKKLSVFILTDGRWGSHGVERHIERLVKKVGERGFSRTQVAIQFVSFGSDLEDLSRLQRLDVFGREEFGMDIVDTKPFDSDVCAVLYGPIEETMDHLGE